MMCSLAACGTAHHARTLGKGNYGVDLELGGPLTQLGGVYVPLPYALVGGTYGVTDDLDVHARLHLTTAIYEFPGVDVGATYQWWHERRWRPAFSSTLQLYGFSDFQAGGSRGFADLTENLSYLVHRRWLTYFGATEFTELVQAPVIFAPFVGEELRLGDHYGVELELKYAQPQLMEYVAPSYARIANQGAIFVELGFNTYFGHGKGWAAPPSAQPATEMIP